MTAENVCRVCIWPVLSGNSISRGSLAACTLHSQQHRTPFIFSLNRWFIREYAKGLTAELIMIMV